ACCGQRCRRLGSRQAGDASKAARGFAAGPSRRLCTAVRRRVRRLLPFENAAVFRAAQHPQLGFNSSLKTGSQPTMTPRVLISDALSDAAVQIFKDRGIDTEFQPTLGADKETLAEGMGAFEGLAIRWPTRLTGKPLQKAHKPGVVGRGGIGVDNVDIPAATAKGVIVMNTPFGNSITTAEHAITLML